MNFGKNLQYLRFLQRHMTQEELAQKLDVSRQTISKWELGQGNPELSKIEEICLVFNCNADELLFGDLKIKDDSYSEIIIESQSAFQYIEYTVISQEPEDDATHYIKRMSESLNIPNSKIIGWDFPYLSQEQTNVFRMHGYTAALVFDDTYAFTDTNHTIKSRPSQGYVTITIKEPMKNPFHSISNAFKSLFQYIGVNRYTYDHFSYEYLYQQSGHEFMKISVAIKEGSSNA